MLILRNKIFSSSRKKKKKNLHPLTPLAVGIPAVGGTLLLGDKIAKNKEDAVLEELQDKNRINSRHNRNLRNIESNRSRDIHRHRRSEVLKNDIIDDFGFLSGEDKEILKNTNRVIRRSNENITNARADYLSRMSKINTERDLRLSAKEHASKLRNKNSKAYAVGIPLIVGSSIASGMLLNKNN